MVESDAVVTVFECEHALNLVRLDHRGQHILHRQRILADRTILTAEVIGHCEDATEVI
jgi:hypothetical protein